MVESFGIFDDSIKRVSVFRLQKVGQILKQLEVGCLKRANLGIDPILLVRLLQTNLDQLGTDQSVSGI